MKVPRPIHRAYDWVKTVFIEYSEDNGGIVAAAVSFYTFISLIPLILVGVSVFGFILGSQARGEALILEYVHEYLPSAAIAEKVRTLIAGIIEGRAPAGIAGFVLVLWSGSSIFANLETALNIAWDTPEKRSFLKVRALSLGMLLFVGILLLSSFALTTGATALERQAIFGFNLSRIPFVWELLAYLIPPVLSLIMFTTMYKVLPSTNVPLKAALVGGIVAGILFETLKFGFSWYLVHFADYGRVYGSLATVILLVFWIYYSANITILGAEVSQIYAGHSRVRNGKAR